MSMRLPQPSLLLERWWEAAMATTTQTLPASTPFQEEWFLKVQTLSTTDEMSSIYAGGCGKSFIISWLTDR
jgi:hypothetical protein